MACGVEAGEDSAHRVRPCAVADGGNVEEVDTWSQEERHRHRVAWDNEGAVAVNQMVVLNDAAVKLMNSSILALNS